METPTRRNKNIGTAKQGRGRNNRADIPWPYHDSSNLGITRNAVWIPVEIKNNKFHIVVEPTRPGHVHSCTIDDLITMLGHVPEKYLMGIKFFILKQPTRKQIVLRPVWGKFLYGIDADDLHGGAVFLWASKPETVFVWPKSICPLDQREMNRLEAEGHRLVLGSKAWNMISLLGATRHTQLYRTLPHEIYHFHQYYKHVLAPLSRCKAPATVADLKATYDSLTYQVKEDYANRHAEALFKELKSKGHVPFSRIVDYQFIIKNGCRPKWFITEDCDI
jgi:hypothetical protein